MTRATVITDASFCHKTKAAGWAVWIVFDTPIDGTKRLKRSGVFKAQPKTSSEAERFAMFNGLALAYNWGARRILVQSDCEGILRHDCPIYQKAAKGYWPTAIVLFRHVKGHQCPNTDARSFVNNWCDYNAKRHMRAQRTLRA